MNISDHAHKQNSEARQKLKALGYEISLGHDGWSVFKGADEVAKGYPERGLVGEQRNRNCLDAAVAKAWQLYRADQPPPPPPAPKPEPKATVPEALASGAVQKAISFLKMAGAQYTIEVNGETYSNVPKRVRQDAKSHYMEALKPYEGQNEFMTTIQVPKEMDLDKYRGALSAYLKGEYGEYITNANREDHTISVMVVKGV